MMVPLSLDLDEAVLVTLDRLAEATGSTRGAPYADREAWQIAQIEAGLAAADDGRFASEEDVRRIRAKFAQSA